MKRLRIKLGVWLLAPYLRAEYQTARLGHKNAADERRDILERYWMGRMTAVRRILNGVAR